LPDFEGVTKKIMLRGRLSRSGTLTRETSCDPATPRNCVDHPANIPFFDCVASITEMLAFLRTPDMISVLFFSVSW